MNDPVFESAVPQEPPRPQADPQKERSARRAISRLGLALATFILLPQLMATVLYATAGLLFPEVLETDWFLWAVQIFSMYIVGLSAFFLILGHDPLPAIEGARERFSPFRLFVLFSILMACSVSGSMISNLLTTVVGILRGAPIEDTTTEIISTSPLIYIFLVVVVIGPIVEELVFRYATMRVLLPYGERNALLLSGLIFGLMHGNLFQLFYTFAIGVLLSYLYSRTGKLRYPILMHMLFNFFGGFLPAALLQFLPIDELLAVEPTFELILSYLFPLLGLLLYELVYYGLAIAGFVFLILRFSETSFREAACPLEPRSWVRAHFLNVGMLSFFAVSLLLLILSLF